jgi:perosamine synthetase
MTSEKQISQLKFHTFDASQCRFPKAKLPVLPHLGYHSFGLKQPARFVTLDSLGHGHFFSRGRYALHQAYIQAGVGKDSSLLAPAYHCRTMLDPAIRLQGEIRFYPLDRSLNPDWDALKKLVRRTIRPVRAILLTHFFGFSPPSEKIQELKKWTEELGISLIEDCSHAFIRPKIDSQLGEFGDFVVASPYKFFPSEDGGLLITNATCNDNFTPKLSAPTLKAEIRGVAHAIRHLLAHKGTNEPISDEELKRGKIDALARGCQIEQTGYQLSPMYDPESEQSSGLLISKLALYCINSDRVADLRRTNFARLLDGVANLPHCRPVFSSLPKGVVPYMFPLYIEHPDPHFFVLKHLGMPIWRWDDMAFQSDLISDDYRLNLLHLPCHQGLKTDDIDWIISTLKVCMANTHYGNLNTPEKT